MGSLCDCLMLVGLLCDCVALVSSRCDCLMLMGSSPLDSLIKAVKKAIAAVFRLLHISLLRFLDEGSSLFLSSFENSISGFLSSLASSPFTQCVRISSKLLTLRGITGAENIALRVKLGLYEMGIISFAACCFFGFETGPAIAHLFFILLWNARI